jgi:hypothetical protein
VRLPLIIATTVLVVVGVLTGVVALGSAAGGDPPTVEPITVRAPALPPAAPGGAPQEPAPRDQEGFVAPPPPVDDDDADDLDDDPSDTRDDGPNDDD